MQPLVSICSLVYNHAPYLRQCLDGFVMQQTTFPFEVVIHDDASTDGSAAIIREYATRYPNIFVPIYQTENQYSQGKKVSSTFVFPRARGKYIALCEGDDYWTDPLKLQKQVDFLEANPEYGLVRTDVNRLYQETQMIDTAFFSHPPYSRIKDTYADYLVNAWFAAPCTWVFKRSLLEYVPTERFVVGDLPLLLTIVSKERVKYINEVTSVYRILSSSASHFKTDNEQMHFMDGIAKILCVFGKHAPLGVKTRMIVFSFLRRMNFVVKRKFCYCLYPFKGLLTDLQGLFSK